MTKDEIDEIERIQHELSNFSMMITDSNRLRGRIEEILWENLPEILQAMKATQAMSKFSTRADFWRSQLDTWGQLSQDQQDAIIARLTARPDA